MIILSAARAAPRDLPRGTSPVARQGLSYERKFVRALESASTAATKIDHNPWFAYKTLRAPAPAFCCPDIITFSPEDEFITVFELKRTWTPEAAQKLQELYCPVVAKALGIPAVGVVVCKNLTPESPRPSATLSFALLTNPGLYHWIGNAPVRY